MIKHVIIPIFVPQVGCPHDCVFCDQNKITGQDKMQTNKINGDFVRATVNEYLKTIDRENTSLEISFFGGTFTGIDIRLQKELLSVAKEFKDSKTIDYIRLSTRPDYINHYILNHLKNFDVDIIELGVQSFDEQVLEISKRGYKKESIYNASRLIKEFGFTLGHQLMLGLPFDNFEKDMYSMEESIGLNIDLVRIYPALIIKGTEMESLYNAGKYLPYSLEKAVEISSLMIERFEKENIKVIRVGLQPTKEINEGAEIVSGPFHPAFRELAESYILYKKLKKFKNKDIYLDIENKNLSKLYSDKKRYFKKLKDDNINVKVNIVDSYIEDIINIREIV